jgi:NAD(P)-dependent dehydrogenase (short-subunit alcohol dehydrogenase family)
MFKMSEKLKNKVAFITGGNSGIGLATAKLFAQNGAKVIIIGQNAQTLEEAKHSIEGDVLAIQADITNLKELDKAFDQAYQTFGKIDVLFANAGIGKFAPISAVTEHMFDDLMNVNVKGLFFTVQRALPHLNRNASVILSGSFLSFTGLPNTSVLSATKAAVSSFGKTLAAELAPLSFRVNTLSPGYIATPFASKSGLPPEALVGLVSNALVSTPLNRLGTPDEMTKVALFLASDDASYLVGSDILADGGVVYA